MQQPKVTEVHRLSPYSPLAVAPPPPQQSIQAAPQSPSGR
jgi:hypothetical protein